MTIELGFVFLVVFVDVIYEISLLKVVILSEVPLNYLFSNEKPEDLYTSNEHRALMDDLAISKDSVRFLGRIYKF